MANYKKMYAILCGAIDEVLDDLNRIPFALPSAAKLQKALLDAEDEYVKAENPTVLGFPEGESSPE